VQEVKLRHCSVVRGTLKCVTLEFRGGYKCMRKEVCDELKFVGTDECRSGELKFPNFIGTAAGIQYGN